MKVTDDERERAVLIERAQALARVPAAPRDGEDLLVVEFSVGDEHFCVDAADVREVVRLRHLTPVPGVPAAVRGVTTYRGEILAAVDVRSALGPQASGLSDLLWLLVLGAEAPELGLLASHVSGVVPIRSSELRSLAAESSDRARRLCRAITERAALVLDGEALLADAEIFALRGGASSEHADREM